VNIFSVFGMFFLLVDRVGPVSCIHSVKSTLERPTSGRKECGDADVLGNPLSDIES
jgi:hypothetical protein